MGDKVNNPIQIQRMRFQRSDIFASKNTQPSHRLQNSCLSSHLQSRQPKTVHEGQLYKIIAYKTEEPISKQRVHNRCNLVIEYTPEFVIVSETSQKITVKIKQYSLELLPWLIKKDALFKVNIVLGIYIAFLELVDVYGIFPLHPNMMKVSERQEVAVWINKNYEVMEPDQVLTKNDFSVKEFVKSFLRIFRCCLPNKSTSQIYSDSKQLLNDLAKIKRKEEMHKNCHQFIKHNSKIGSSRRSNRYQSNSIIQHLKKTSSVQKNLTKPNLETNHEIEKSQMRFSSFSPPQRLQRVKTSIEKINQTAEFKRKSNASFGGNFLKNKQSLLENQKSQTLKTSISKQPSLCSSGELFKRYLMFSTSKYQQMSKTQTPPVFSANQNKNHFPKDFIFRSEVYKQNQSAFSQMVVEERNSVQVMSQHFVGLQEEKAFTPVKFRKMSSNTNERPKEVEGPKKFMNSTGWKKSFKEQENYFFSTTEHEDNTKTEPKQKLKNSFPYKTASTINSFRLSNQHQYHIFPSKSEQNLNNCQAQSNVTLQQKEKDRKIEEMKIVEQNELENDFNNIFSMQNSNFMREENQKELDMIITEFQGVLF